jgi:hypothetical protein
MVGLNGRDMQDAYGMINAYMLVKVDREIWVYTRG